MKKCKNQNFLGKNGKTIRKGYFSPNTMKLYPKVGQYQKIAFLLISRNLAFSELFRSLYMSISYAGAPIDKQMFGVII